MVEDEHPEPATGGALMALPPNTKILRLRLDIWEKIIDVQQHFNDIQMRIRNLCLTLLGTLLAAAAYSMKEKLLFNFLGITLPGAAYVLLIAFVILVLFWFMDASWYHRYLIGAVKCGEALEESLQGELPGIGLTKAISQESHQDVGSRVLRSRDRLNLFYGVLAYVSLSALLLSIWRLPILGVMLLVVGIVIAILYYKFGMKPVGVAGAHD